jgi:hypothetical protein
LLMDFNSQQLHTTEPHERGSRRSSPETLHELRDLLALIGSPDEIAPIDTPKFTRKLVEAITGSYRLPREPVTSRAAEWLRASGQPQ